MKNKTIFLILFFSCSPYIVIERQFGLKEPISYEKKRIISIDTIRNDTVGVIKIVKILEKIKRAPVAE